MKRYHYRYWLLAALSLPVCFHIAHARVVVQHLGANDPLTEEFVLSRFTGNPDVGPVFNDLGRDAWMIKTNGVQDIVEYQHFLTEQEQQDAMTFGWVLSATVRFVDLPSVLSDLGFHTGDEIFWFRFSTHPDGFLRVSDTRGTSYSLDESDGGYHSYSLVYDPLTELAKLWVDGIDTGVDFLPRTSTSPSMLRLAAGETATEAYWHEITLTIIPEPTTMALLSGVGALIFASIVRRRRPKDRNRSREQVG